ncbi:hypothetical protein [Rhabdaerophilum sp. SD176]|uniref:hypothetical protein n=1 Tax=Rhabdaerophilum sp. SD176 TaxID=2983548 RepID=UPI0024DF4E9E|nr:hypothetical protein [Rhabdaerophilum sp. SD176]
MHSLPREALQRLTRELAGEPILWAGQPAPGLAFWRAALLWLFAVPWTAFSLAWEGIALAAFFSAEPGQRPEGVGAVLIWIFPLFGLPFVLIGLWMLAKPFLEARKARRTVHVLTEKRLITAELGEAISLTSLPPSRIVEITRRAGPAGTGTLSLSLGQFRDNDGDRVEKVIHLLGVPDVEQLDRELRRLMG